MSVTGDLQLARGARGLSLRDVEQRSGVGASALSRYERGEKIPRADTLDRLADALGLEVTVRPARRRNDRLVDLLCQVQADALLADPGLLGLARDALGRLGGRSASHDAWRLLLDAGVEAVVGVLTSTSPHARALKADSPLAFVVEVDETVRARLVAASARSPREP